MALKLSTTTSYGIDCPEAYFKIVQTNINWLTRQAHIEIAGWLTEDARRSGKASIMTRSFDWQGDDFPFDMGELDKEGVNLVKIAYEKIKTLKVKEYSVDENGSQVETEVDGEFADSENC